MARNKILIERGRLVVTDASGDVVLAAQTSKKYAGRIDVHLEGFIAHMDYDQAKSEFKKVGVNSESFEQAFSKLKKNPSDDPWIVVLHYDTGWEYLGKAQTLAEAKRVHVRDRRPFTREDGVWWSQKGGYAIGKHTDLEAAGINVNVED